METITMKPAEVERLEDNSHENLLFAVPQGFDIRQLERLYPEAVKKLTDLETVEAFIAYVAHHEDSASQVFFSREKLQFLCVFDYHEKGDANRCKSIARLNLQISDELRFWMPARVLSHRELVEAVIDHEEFLTGGDAGEIIQALRRLEVRSASTLESTVDPETGDISVNWTTEKTSGGVKVPRVLNFAFPIFRFHDEEHFYEFEVRIRVQHGREGEFGFAVQMKNPERNIRREIAGFAGRVSDGVSAPMFQGVPKLGNAG